MRLGTKLILAFLLVSLFSTGFIALFTRAAANREFDRFVSDKYKSELAAEVAGFYARRNSWENIRWDNLPEFVHRAHEEDRPPFISIADSDGIIVLPNQDYSLHQQVSPQVLQAGTPIQVNSQTVGFLLLNAAPDRNPLELEFIRRFSRSITFAAIGAILLAFLLGAVLSRTISRPIQELTRATRDMAGGNFGQRVPVRSRDEIGDLAASFNQMNDDLVRSFNLRRQMTADIAHELRTPLSLILGHAEAVHDGVLPPSRENFEIIREEAGRLETLVNDLRILSLADAGELSIDFQRMDVNKLLADIRAHYRIQFTQKDVALEFTPHPAPEGLPAQLDPFRFSQVISNILDNALRYTPPGGRVEITTRRTDRQIEIAIQDTGAGISSQDAQHLFDRFYRADPSRSREEGGSGLGLAIAKSIVETHHGSIHAVNADGAGLRIVILLPLAAPPPGVAKEGRD